MIKIMKLIFRSGSDHLTNHSKYLLKMIWLGCISVCIPLILACVVYYQFSTNRVQKQILSEIDSSLSTTKERTERMLQSIEQESLQLSVDPILTNFFLNSDDEAGWLWHRDLLDKINVVKNSDSFIDEIYFYNTLDGTVLSNRYGVIAKESYPYKNDIEQIVRGEMRSQWAYLPDSQKDGYVTFARLLPNLDSKGTVGVLAFEIEKSAISNFMESNTYILPQGNNMFVIQNKLFPGHQEMGYDQAISLLKRLGSLAKIKESDNQSGHFKAEGIDGSPAQFYYLKNIYGRIYVSIVPDEIMADQLNWIRGIALLILIIFLSFGVFLTYFTSKRAYNPIVELMKHSKALSNGKIQIKENELDYIKECLDFLNKETEKLEGVMSSLQPTLREMFLQQFINGEYLRKEPLIRDCEANGISVQATNVVLIVDTDNLAKDSRFRPEEKGIIAFVISNVVQELLHSHPGIKGYVIPDRGRGIALLQFMPDCEQQEMLDQTLEFATSVCASLKYHLKIQASVGIGRFYFHIEDVPVSRKEAESALQYRIFNHKERVLFIENLENEKKQKAFRFPREYEKAIIDALEREDEDAASEGLSAFADMLSQSHSYSSIYQSYNLLLSTLITSLERQGVNMLDILENNLFGQLQAMQTSQEIFDWFSGSLFPMYIWLRGNTLNGTGQSLVRQVCKHIRENCGSDLSLIRCADQVGLSPSHLSRLFKKEMGINFLDFVMECKVEEAKRLLADTDQNVSEIAAAIGYSERNLNRIFQRYTKMSPSIFRMSMR